jgi:hypothetical protein
MSSETASRTYNRRLFVTMAIFLAATAVLGFGGERLPRGVTYPLTAAAILLLLAPFWALYRYLSEIDEFLRWLHVRAVLVALSVVMAVSTAWGFLELYAEVPALSVYWLNPLFWIAYSLAVVAGNHWANRPKT